MKKGIACVIFAACLLTGCKSKVNYIEQGTLALGEQRYEEAVSSFEKSVEEKEDIPEAYRGLGMAYYEQKDYGNALDAFQKMLENGGEATPAVYNLMGVSSMHLDDNKGALEAFKKGIELAGTDADKKDGDAPDYKDLVQEMKLNEIVCYENLKDWETAKSKAEAYLADYPDDKDAQKEVQFLETR